MAALVFLAASSVSAEGNYLGIGLGLQVDLGSLGGTIAKDGLDSTQGKRSNLGSSALAGCGGTDNAVTNASTRLCYTEVQGNFQELIIPENTLISLEKNTNQLFRAYTSGPMQGLVIDVFWESEGDGTFWRVGVSHTRKILGGETRSTLANFEWYKIEWDFYSWTIPFYYGVKAKIGESGAVYGGLGINYTRGGWNLGGTNAGDIPTELVGSLTGPVGAHSYVNTGDVGVSEGEVYKEAVKFRHSGIGWNALMGVESKLDSGDALFFEIEYIVNGGQDTAYTKSVGGIRGLSASPSYPIVTGGTKYKFGYKMAM